jgi:hypothetical protein
MRRTSTLTPYFLTLLLAFSIPPRSFTSASAPDLSGQWAGAVTAGSMSGALEIAISQEGGAWAASVKMDMGGKQALTQAGDLKATETELSFTMEFAGANVRFVGKVEGEKISGVLEATVDGRVVGSGSWTVARISAPQHTPEKTNAVASTNPGQARVIGEITELDRALLRLLVRLDSGALIAVKLDPATSYLRVSPEESSLEKAVPIPLAEVGAGDRVYARGQEAEDKAVLLARQLIVMTKADLAQKQERERTDWRRRGVVGVVTALNPNTKEITLLMRAPDGARPLTMKIREGVRFRRYAPDSVKFSDTRMSSFMELRVDDQLRALGEKSADGSEFMPEEIVSGSFHILGGVVSATNQQSEEITIKELQTQKLVTIVISKNSLLRQLTPEFAAMVANRARRGNASAAKSPSNALDPEEAVGRMPDFTVSELRPGDRVIVSCVRNATPARVIAIGLFIGVDPLFKLLQEQLARQRGGAASNLSLGLPMGVF